MKKIGLFFLSMVIAVGLMAQNVITGTAKLKGDEQAVAGVTVMLGSSNQQIVTNEDGSFTLSSENTGSDVLIFSGNGIINYQRIINVQSGKTDVGVIYLTINAQSAVEEDMMLTISEEELDAEGSSQNVSGLLSSQGDVFTSNAGYQFSSMRFRMRGLDGKYNQTYLNGVLMNDAERGWFTYSQIGGLNDMVRTKETVNATEANTFSFGNVGGAVNINARASAVRKGFKVSQVASNRTYTTRTMVTYATGLMNNGWAFAVSGSYRWAKEGYVAGTFYDAWAFAVAAEKRFNEKHSLSLTVMGAPTNRGQQAGSTQEAYDLTPKDNFFFVRIPGKGYGNNNYNANWGYQNGVMRNAKQVKSFTPIAIFSHEWKIDEASKLTTSLGYKYQMDGRTAMNWYKAADPRPDYYRNLPNYHITLGNEAAAEVRKQLWMNDESYRQINWDKMYQTNYLANAQGKSGRYMIENRRNDQQVVTLNSVLNYKFNEAWRLDGGLEVQMTIANHFKLVDDLLGADYWLDIDQYGERDNPGNPDFMQNDLNNPNRKVYVGDKFGYNYDIYANNAKLWAQATYSASNFDVYFGAQAHYSNFWRYGHMNNGRSSVDTIAGMFNGNVIARYAIPNSYGLSPMQHFMTYAVKAGINYRITGRHILTLNIAHGTNPILANNAYFSPRVKASVIPNMTPENYFTADLSYFVRTPVVNGRVTVYATDFKNASELSSFYYDEYNTYVNFAMYDFNKRHIGAELGLEFNLGAGVSIDAIAAVGQNVYTSNPTATITTENGLPFDDYGVNQIEEIIYVKGFHVDGTPEVAASIGIHYFHPKYWFFDLNLNYFTNTYMDFNPFRRTYTAIAGLDRVPDNIEELGVCDRAGCKSHISKKNVNLDQALYDYYVDNGYTIKEEGQIEDVLLLDKIRSQERLKGGFSLDASIGKSIRINYKYYLNINLSATNILNNRMLKTGGYEQSRFSTTNETTNRATYLDRFPSKYFYAYGATIYLNVGFRF